MSTFEKMKDLILKKPTVNNIMPKDLQNFLIHYGFVLKRIKGDHFIYSLGNDDFVISIPMHKPVKQTYIDQVRTIITENESEKEGD